ncbi:MAG: ABC transporter substrate-binding protein [Rhodobacterales bacterium]|nr:ABC transporter substrate-binding protein [Rhodobacterales bacterium]MDX5388860.1 ABC transporter substrate-binding protein [Rhodobacterales bacterium]MDX5488549.1 ABC transporter substrate-binding protein [Rhodobacterales bacterium]
MTIRKLMTTLLASVAMASAAQAADLRIGLQEDPDALDTDQARTFVGRIVFESLCDKLVNITPDLQFIPELATSWEWSNEGKTLTMKLREDALFHDGTPFNAEAVVANIERSTTLPESRRKSELSSVETVVATGPYEVTFNLKSPDATLIAQLSDRAGMMISPTAAAEKGLELANSPVCSGPYKFVERIQQDRIVLEKFADHYDAESYSFDRLIFLPIPDTTVRLANLRSGDLDMLERLAPSDVAGVKADGNLAFSAATSLGYQGITVNVNNGARSETPFGKDKRVRQALSLAIDREVINQVVFEGVYAAGNQPFPPTSPWYDQTNPVPARDVDAAKALLAEAGLDGIKVEIQAANNPVQLQLMQVVQAMAAEAGIEISIKATEFATMLQEQSAGNYDATQVGWSGRTDPDGNIHSFMTCAGGLNDSKFCMEEIDALLNKARTSTDVAERKASYDAANAILREELPIIYLYHQTWLWAMSNKIKGFSAYPDGMIRLSGVTME